MSCYKDLGQVIKSPLDKNGYKAIKCCSNGMKAFLISNLEHPVDIQQGKMDKETCAYVAIKEFNEEFLEMERDLKYKGNNDKTATDKKKSCTNAIRNAKKSPNSQVTVVLVIGSGSLNNPITIPGIAHLVEHLVFLGSENYPDTNAETTWYEVTLEVENNLKETASNLEVALKILCDMVTKPILKDADIHTEIESINTEFNTIKLEDDSRYLAFLLSLMPENHPMGRFNTGSRQSFKATDPLKLQQCLKDWIKHNYIPTNMVISIEAPLTVEKMADLVTQTFGAIPANFCDPRPRSQLLADFKDIPLVDRCGWNMMTKLMPISHHKFLKIAWVLEAPENSEYRTKPLQFISYLVASKAPGGLDLYLRDKGWLLNLTTCCSPGNPDWGYCSTRFCTIFFLTLTLTHAGLENRDEVIRAVFSYLNLLQNSSNCALKLVFDEMKQTNVDSFHYRSDRNISDADPINKTPFVPFVPDEDPWDNDHGSILMHFAQALIEEVKPEEVITSQLVTRTFDPDLIKGYLAHLTPKKANIVIAAAEFEPCCAQEERLKYLKVKSCSKKVEPTFLTLLQKVGKGDFKLPPRNKFIERSLCYPKGPSEMAVHNQTIDITKNDKMKIVYSNSPCLKGHLTTALYTMTLASPLVLDTNVYGVIPTMAVWTKCLEYFVESQLGSALSALVTCLIEFEDSTTKLICQIGGPSNRLPEIFKIVTDSIRDFEKNITEKKWIFENMAEAQIDDYEDLIFNSEKFGDDLLQNVIVQQTYILSDHTRYLVDIDFTDFLIFIETFKEFLYVSVTLSGCVSKSHGEIISEAVKDMMLKSSSWTLTRDMVKLNRGIILPLGERCLRILSTNDLENNNLVINHYQFGVTDERTQGILEGILPSLNDFAFERLRTVQHIGYVVTVEIEDAHSVAGITVHVNASADRFTPHYIDEKVDKFMSDYFLHILADKAEYNSKVNAHFEPKDKIKWAEVKLLFRNYFLPKGPSYRKVSIQVLGFPEESSTSSKALCKPLKGSRIPMLVKKYGSGKCFKADKDDPLSPWTLNIPKSYREENGYFITNLNKFKNELGCYPNELPFENFIVGNNSNKD